MRRGLQLLAGVLLCMSASPAPAADEPLRDAASENGRFRMRIRAGRPGLDALRGCKATLLDRTPERGRTTECWERFLVNEVAPGSVQIRDDGRFVVTLDEFRLGGARHAVVIYGPHGELLRHFLLPDLLQREDWQHVKLRERSVDWLEGARFQFATDAPQFVITLKHGRQIRIDLNTLRVVPPSGSGGSAKDIPPNILAALSGPPADSDVGANPVDVSAAAPGQEEQTAAMARAIAGDAASTSAAPDTAEPPAPSTQPTAAAASAPAPADVDSVPAAALHRAADGLPAPDPAHPVDYVAWANTRIATDGPNAGPAYITAIEQLVTWTGDDELYRAAERGEPAALLSPAIQSWLDVNLPAIQAFRNAAHLDFAGWTMVSPNGSLLGVTLPQLAPLRTLAKITLMDGKRAEARGDAARAVTDYSDTLSAGASIGGGPTLVENLVGSAVQSLAAKALLDLPAGLAAAVVDYRDLAARLAASRRTTRPLAAPVEFERAMYLDTVQRIYQVDARTGDYVLNTRTASALLGAEDSVDAPDERLSAAQFRQMVAVANEFYDSVEATSAQPYQDAQRRLEEIEVDVGRRAAAGPLLKQLAPSLARTHFIHTRTESLRRAAALIAHIMAFHQEHGTYPRSLSVFGEQDFVLDAFTDQPFRYRRTGDDFLLYSVGANGTDEGGLHDPRAEQNDFVFWPRPQPPPQPKP